jgi:hypothetical protein
MNYRNDLDECLTDFSYFFIYPILEYYFMGCLTYFHTLINYEAERCPSCWRAIGTSKVDVLGNVVHPKKRHVQDISLSSRWDLHGPL